MTNICYRFLLASPYLYNGNSPPLLPGIKNHSKIKINTHLYYESNSDACNFTSSIYAAVNSNLKLLTATDQDNGENGRVTYSIVQSVRSDSTDLFAVDSNTGMVTLEKSLDREKAAEHVLFIMAQDNATPQLSGK